MAHIGDNVVDNISLLQNNESTNASSPPAYHKVLDHMNFICYLLICAIGLFGNCLVIYVVLMYAKMKTVTNMYILSLALSDVMFLVMLPLTATTVITKHWIFGFVMCKIHFIFSAVNTFGGAFNLCVMSADRYMAVCHPILSLKFRTPKIAMILCICVWALSFTVMLPVILYTSTQEHHTLKGKYSCNLLWPENQSIPPDKAFIWYSFILGFAIPVPFISLLYTLIIVRLRHVGAARKSLENRKCPSRVTRLVLAVIVVYIVCWLPYWCFQVHSVFHGLKVMNTSTILMFNGFTILSYANSMLNPLLYAFLSDNFRQSFVKAFKFMSSLDGARSVCKENSFFPRTSQTFTRAGVSATQEERVELCNIDNSTVSSPPLRDLVYQDEHGFLKPPVHL